MAGKKTSNKPGVRKGEFADAHKALLANLAESVGDTQTLGRGNAVTIVCACANTTPLNLSRTLKQLGLSGFSFQSCVFRSVTKMEFVIDEDDIPDGPDDTLSSVVDVIEDAVKEQG